VGLSAGGGDPAVEGDVERVQGGLPAVGPAARPLRTLLATRRARTAKHVTNPGPWLSPSQHPDRPALPETITHRLQRVGIQPTAHRTAALLQLAGELPPAILGDLLGLGRTTIQEWSSLAGRPWASYIADRLSDGSAQGDELPLANHHG
jgi:hypothetical protein